MSRVHRHVAVCYGRERQFKGTREVGGYADTSTLLSKTRFKQPWSRRRKRKKRVEPPNLGPSEANMVGNQTQFYPFVSKPVFAFIGTLFNKNRVCVFEIQIKRVLPSVNQIVFCLFANTRCLHSLNRFLHSLNEMHINHVAFFCKTNRLNTFGFVLKIKMETKKKIRCTRRLKSLRKVSAEETFKSSPSATRQMERFRSNVWYFHRCVCVFRKRRMEADTEQGRPSRSFDDA